MTCWQVLNRLQVQTLRHDNVISLIALNGRRFRKSEELKAKDYKKALGDKM